MAGEERKRSADARARRHIIERPRLTRLLDQTDARIILLVAPAGYGKTTLARQWLRHRPHAWYRAAASSTDVAALAVGLAEAASSFDSDISARVHQRVQATPNPEQALDDLAALLGSAINTWPSDAWLAIDDYHAIATDPAADGLLQQILQQTPRRFFVTSRRRPEWATPDRLLSGEIFELGQQVLAMDQDEAAVVLAGVRFASPSGVVALAQGWPAVIALAAVARDHSSPAGSKSTTLYEYFAEDVYRFAHPNIRTSLCALAIAPSVTRGLADHLFGRRANAVLDEATRIGFLMPRTTDVWELHPLVRNFLADKLRELPSTKQDGLVAAAIEYLLAQSEWDEAMDSALRFERRDLAWRVLGSALIPMLAYGRIATIRRWVTVVGRGPGNDAIVALAEAEVAFREGHHERAEALAAAAARRLADDDPMAARAWFRAGQAAHFTDRNADALAHLERARDLAVDDDLRLEAQWAAFITALEFEHPRASDYLAGYEAVRPDTIDSDVRVASAGLAMTTRQGGLLTILNDARRISHLVSRAVDPMVQTSFWNLYGTGLVLAAKYDRAVEAAREELVTARSAHLSFVEPHAKLVQAHAYVGQRKFAAAERLLAEVDVFARTAADAFLTLNSALIRARMLVAQRKLKQALASASIESRVGAAALRGEQLALIALILAAVGRPADAAVKASHVFSTTSYAYARVLALFARAVVALELNEEGAAASAAAAFRTSYGLGHLDGLVTAYRAYPPLLAALFQLPDARASLEAVVTATSDERFAAGLGFDTRDPGDAMDGLSRREREVFQLVISGLRNHEIAELLFITEPTVKVHVRHIYEKLGVRNRAEAVAVAANVASRSTPLGSSGTAPWVSPRR